MDPSDADFNVEFQVNPLHENTEQCCHAFVLWFDALFSSRFCKEQSVVLSTSPFEPATHWTQTVLALKNPIILGGTEGAQGIKCRLSMSRGDSHRSLDLSIEYWAIRKDGLGERNVVLYLMAIGQKPEKM